MLIVLIRYILLFLLILFLARLVKDFLVGGSSRKRMSGGKQRTEMPRDSEDENEMVMDPVCGTFVSIESPYRATVGGKRYSFCGTECLDRFKSGEGS